MSSKQAPARAAAPAAPAARPSIFANKALMAAAASKAAAMQQNATFSDAACFRGASKIAGVTLIGTVLSFEKGIKKSAVEGAKPGPSMVEIRVDQATFLTAPDPALAELDPLGGWRILVKGMHVNPPPSKAKREAAAGAGAGAAQSGASLAAAVAASAVPAAVPAMLFGDLDASLAADAGVAPADAGFVLGANAGSAALQDEVFAPFLVEANTVVRLRTFAADFGRGEGVAPVVGDIVRCDDTRPSFYFFNEFTTKDGKTVPAGPRISLQTESVTVVREDALGANMPQPVGNRDLITTLAARGRVTAPVTLRPWSGTVEESCMRKWAPGRYPAKRYSEWSDEEKEREVNAQRVRAERILMFTPGALLSADDDEASASAKCIELPGVGATFYGDLLVGSDAEEILRKGKNKPLIDSSIEQTVQVITESSTSEFKLRLTLMFSNAVIATGCANPETFLQFMTVYSRQLRIAARCAPEIEKTGKSSLNADGSALGAIVLAPKFTLHPGHKDWEKGRSKYVPMITTNLPDLVRSNGFPVSLDYVLRAFNIVGKGVQPPNPYHGDNMLHQMESTPPVYNIGEYEGNVRVLSATHEFFVLFLEDENNEGSESGKLRERIANLDVDAARKVVADCIEEKAHKEIAVRTLGRIIYAVAIGVGADRGTPSEFDRASALEGRITLDAMDVGDNGAAEQAAAEEAATVAAEQAAARKKAAAAAAAKKTATTTTTTATAGTKRAAPEPSTTAAKKTGATQQPAKRAARPPPPPQPSEEIDMLDAEEGEEGESAPLLGGGDDDEVSESTYDAEEPVVAAPPQRRGAAVRI